MGILLQAVLILNSACAPAVTVATECDYGLSVCEAYAKADLVFIGKVTNLGPQFMRPEQSVDDIDQTAYVTIEKIYKGTKRRSITLRQLGRRRTEKFVYGARYLFYANYDRAAKIWEVKGCGRTRMAEYANDDLRYLDGLPASSKRTRISGEATRFYHDSDLGRMTERVAGLRIKIVGEGKEYETVTDEHGVYEVLDARSGKYKLQLKIPEGLTFLFAIHNGPLPISRVTSLEIELKEGNCSGADIVLDTIQTSR